MREGNKRPLYYCRRLTPADKGYKDGVETFSPPVLRYLNYKAIDGESTLQTIGEVDNKHLIAKQISSGDTYTINDRCYINRSLPKTPDPLCADADFRVSSALLIHRTEEIVFERMAANANS
jgi:hypothetical protein